MRKTLSITLTRSTQIIAIAVVLLCMLSCSGGVDIAEQNRVLTSFELTWPEDFCFTCLSNEPVTVTIKALDQNGALFTSWSGSVDIELTNAQLSVSPAAVNLSSGIVARSISFYNGSSDNQETGITLSSEGVVADLGVTVLVYTAEAATPSGFRLAWPSGFDYACASNEPLEVTIDALDGAGDMLVWSGSVDILLTNTMVTVNPSTVTVSGGTIQQNIAFNNATVQNQETGIKLSYGDAVTELQDTIAVYETIPPSDVGAFTATAWDGQIGLSWTNPPELDFEGVRILRKESGPPANAGDGDLVYEGDAEEYVDTGLANGTTYFYSAFSYDYAPNYSNGVTANETPEGHSVDARFFPGNRKVKLIWEPDGDAESYTIYYTDDGTDPDGDNYTGMIWNIEDVEYEISELNNFVAYRFAVTAVKGGLDSRGSTVLRTVPPGAVMAAGVLHTVALNEDGTVWSWGNNDDGQLGDATTDPSNTPVQAVMELEGDPLTGVVAIAAGYKHTVTLKEDGTAWTWGYNYYGQLGDGNHGSGAYSDTPVQVKGEGGVGTLQDVIAVAAGEKHTVALMEDGTAWTWGRNYNGQLGDGNMPTDHYTPVQVVTEHTGEPLTGVIAVAAGDYHTVALREDGTVWAWGANDFGQLGDGTDGTDRDKALQVITEPGGGPLTGVVAITAGWCHTVALKDDGTVWAWGNNGLGQLGDGTTDSSTTPVQTVMELGGDPLAGVAAVAAGYRHNVVLKEDGTVWAWGDNYAGQLGDGNTDTPSYTPVPVKGYAGEGTLNGVAAVTTGTSHTVALKGDGTVWAWGYNDSGQLGDGTSGTNKDTPVRTLAYEGEVALEEVAAVAAGKIHSLAVKEDGTVWAWGYNGYGQLGDGTGAPGTDSDVPVQVVLEFGGDPLTEVTAVAAGDFHTVAVKDDGEEKTVWTWGYNSYGQLGNGTSGEGTDSGVPVQVVMESEGDPLTGVTQVASGLQHTVALKEDGTVWAWGRNNYGQLGDGTGAPGTDSNVPVQVVLEFGGDPLTDVVAVASGGGHVVALKDNGTVWTWGHNAEGQLGNGTYGGEFNSGIPVQVVLEFGGVPLTGVSAVAAAGMHSVSVKDDGTVWTWGYNNEGQLGDGTHGFGPAYASDTPVQVLGEGGAGTLEGAVAAAAGYQHSTAVMDDGTVWAWGDNNYGQLGDGNTDTDSDTPVQVAGYAGDGTLNGVAQAAAGSMHTVALKNDGTVWAWGDNGYGQLGDGTGVPGTDTDTPVSVGFFYIGWN